MFTRNLRNKKTQIVTLTSISEEGVTSDTDVQHLKTLKMYLIVFKMHSIYMLIIESYMGSKSGPVNNDL